jgi:hypothetical protein
MGSVAPGAWLPRTRHSAGRTVACRQHELSPSRVGATTRQVFQDETDCSNGELECPCYVHMEA